MRRGKQEDREFQKNTVKKMMAYQKRAEQMLSKKRTNQHMIRKG